MSRENSRTFINPGATFDNFIERNRVMGAHIYGDKMNRSLK